MSFEALVGELHSNEAGSCPFPARVRFWTRINGDWVRLSLRAGESVETYRSERTDEGFRTEAKYFERSEDGAEIFYQDYVRERDCDGLHSDSGEGRCHVTELATREGYEAPGLLPMWNHS